MEDLLMRDKVTGIGLELKKFIDKSDMKIDEIAKKSKLNKELIIDFIKLKKEPYVNEMRQLFFVLVNSKNNEEFLKIIDLWFKKSC